jgi:hypothetical protein
VEIFLVSASGLLEYGYGTKDTVLEWENGIGVVLQYITIM